MKSSWKRMTAVAVSLLVAGSVGTLVAPGTAGAVTATATTTTVTSSGTPSTYGNSVTLTATITQTAATGTVNFRDNGVSISGCASQAVSAHVATCTLSSLSVASHPITAVYSGDATYATSTSASFSQVVSKIATTTAVTSSLNPSSFGDSVTLTATVSQSAAGGTANFKVATTSIVGCSAQTVTAGVATCVTTALAVASNSITAVYSGDTNYATSTSSALAQVVNKASTTTSVSSQVTPSAYGVSLTYTATVSPSTAAGNVAFTDGGVSISGCTAKVLASGSTTCTVATSTVGSHSIVATYAGNTSYLTSTSSTYSQSVTTAGTTTSVLSSLNPSTTNGGTVTFTATVVVSSGTFDNLGTVSFTDGGVTIAGCGTKAISATHATCAVTGLTADTHSIVATYSGDTKFSTSSSSALSQVVNAAPTTVWVDASSGNNANDGSSGAPLATIAAGMAMVAPGGTVNVASGTYNETVTVSKSLSLLGANVGVSPNGGSRGSESIISGGNGGTGTALSSISVTASNVTVSGFRVVQTTPVTCHYCDANGIYVGPGDSHVTVSDNIVTGVTATADEPLASRTFPAKGIVAQGSTATGPSYVTISDNLVTSITTSGTQHVSAIGIYLGDSTSTGGTNNAITGNHVTGVSSATWGGYGIHMNAATTGTVVTGNTVDTIAGGGWGRGISNEGAETSLTVSNNAVSGVSSATNGAAAGLYFENMDTKSTSAVVSSNRFAATSSGYGIANAYPSATPDVSGNWWDCANGPGAVGCSATTGLLTTSPWIVSYTDDPTKAGQPGFWPTAITTSSAPSITSADHATFTIGSAGSFTVTGTGAPAPTFSVTTGTLPAGVSLNSTTGVLSGTPTECGAFAVTITATNSVSTSPQSFTLTVNDAAAITSADNTTFTTGSAGSFTVTATGYPAPTFSETGTLPAGVSLDSTTGVLSGTPTESGSFSITLGATNGVGSDASQPFTLTVNGSPTITSDDHATFTTGPAGSFTVTATGYPAPSFSETGTLPSGVSFNSTTGVLSGTPTESGSFSITMGANNGVGSDANQPFTLTVNDAPVITSANHTTFTTGSAGSFTVTATGYPAPSFDETGTLPAGVSLNSTTGVLSGTPTASGSFSITMGANNGVGSDATQPFTLTVNAAPTISSGASKVFVKGVAGSFTVTASGYPAPTFSETGTLPTGITLSGSGVLSGTSTQTGSFPVTMTATNGVGTDATQNFTVNVVAAPVFTSVNNATFTPTGSTSVTESARGYPAPTIAVTTGTLPLGVSLDSTTGVLSGTPVATGVTSVTITATNAVSNATQSFTLTTSAGPVITSANSIGFYTAQASTFTVTATGYPSPTFSETGALPAGITLNATTGVLSGTTTAAGTYVIALKASNGIGSGGTQVFTLTVSAAIAAFTSAPSGTAVAGTPYSFTIRTTGALPMVLATPSMSAITAAGLTFTDNGDGTATLAGTPLASAAGVKTWNWKAKNFAGQTLQGFNLTIGLAPSITSAASKSVKTGNAFSMTITSKGYPVATLSATGLPAGVTLVDIGSGKGTLAGTMPAGVHTFTIIASNGVLPNATQQFTLTGK